jgi:hypothetical protein
MPEPGDEFRKAPDQIEAFAADIRALLALTRLRFLLVETRVVRLEEREAPASR